MSGILVFFFSLVSLQQIAATHYQTYLQDETHQTLRTLKSLPSHCSDDLESLILAKQIELPKQVLSCSVTSIVIGLSEVVVDTAYFAFESYEEVPALFKDLTDLRKCLNETSAEAVATCALLYLPGTMQAVEVIVGGLENFVGEMQMIIPLLASEIKQCESSTLSLYKTYMSSVLDKAQSCANLS